jgi:hypothetical protein
VVTSWRYWLFRSLDTGRVEVWPMIACPTPWMCRVALVTPLKAGPFATREEAEAARRRWEESC